jgi:hypothetical protein
MNNNKTVLVAGAVIFRDYQGKIQWLLVKETQDDDWEIAKTIVRKGESSVRGALRLLGQKGGMSARVLEEAGRSGGVSTVNGKTVPRRFIYYVMLTKSQAMEAIGFADVTWIDYKEALKKLPTKKEQAILKESYEYYKKWKKDGSKYVESDDFLPEGMEPAELEKAVEADAPKTE